MSCLTTTINLPVLMRQTFQDIVQFRKVRLPSSDSYDGSVERTACEFARVLPCNLTEHFPSILIVHFSVPTDVFRHPTSPSLRSHGSRGSDVGGTSWLVDGQWSVIKLLDMTNTVRGALAESRKVTPGELEELNFVLEMMVRQKFLSMQQIYPV